MAGPKAPDPNATARAQEGANVRTATTQSRLNMVDQTTPTGTLSYKQTGTWEDGTPKFEAVTNLSAPQQGLQRQQEEFGGLVNQLGIDQTKRLSNHLSAPVSFDGAPAQVTNISDDFSADRGRVEEALMSRINPQLDRDRQSLDTRLVASGLRPGSDAWSRAMETQGQTANDARMQAILGAGNEQQRMFQMAMQNAGLNNQGRQQSIQETLALRNQPLQEIGALMSGGQVSMPQFQNTPQTGVANTDVAGLINSNYQQQVGQYNAMMGGLAGLGGAAIGAPATSAFGRMLHGAGR